MTIDRTWRVGQHFYKRVGGREEAERMIGRARAIGLAGGYTPEPVFCPDRNALKFPAIDGTTGVTLVDQAALSELLAPLLTVRRVSATGLSGFDPFAKINSRLGPNPPSWLTDRVSRLMDTPLGGSSVVHGDFHCGQLIRDAAGRVWVIDLEDMAQGPVEADLGNFAAHLATRPETQSGDLADAVRAWALRVGDAWVSLGGPLDRRVYCRYVDIALTRRALKLRADRGQPKVLTALENLPLFS